MNTARKIIYKLTRFEYWSFSFFYAPLFVYYAYLVIKHRSLFFFTAANPRIFTGGMRGEKKSEVYQLIPDKYLPKMKLFSPTCRIEEVENARISLGLMYPVICKPNIGERGWKVQVIHNLNQLETYLAEIEVDFLLQEYIDLPLELGIFYVRLPQEKVGKITSVAKKGFLSVTGNGKSTVRELLAENERARLSFKFDSVYHQRILDSIPKVNETIQVESIGNHCRGTTFLDYRQDLPEVFSNKILQIAREIPEFYFGRFDLRALSADRPESIKIIELNGAGSEPGHIYQPGFSLFQAYKSVFWHVRMLSKISSENKKRGAKIPSFKEGWATFKEIKEYNRRFKN